MNIKNYFMPIFLTVALLSACTGPVDRLPALPTGTSTNTPFPSSTVVLATSTLRPTQTASLTPPATLEPDQAKATIEALLQEPIDCEAPCLWGITPGQTTLGEAKNIFTRLGLQLENREVNYDFASGLSIKIILRIQKDWIVENLRLSIHPEKNRTGVAREWLAYSPETLIKRYGPPSKVDLFIDRGAPDASYWLNMYFDSVDLIIEYYGHDLSTNLQVCPLTDQFASVRIWMGNNPIHPPSEGVPLEKAASMTIQEFSELMTGNPSQACFNLKREAFP